jgi:signal peptidase I
MTSEPPAPPANPYAPGEALAHDEGQAREAARRGPRRPSRALAIIVALVAYPLPGVGLYLLGRRYAAWIASGVTLFALMTAAAVFALPRLFLLVMLMRILAVLVALGYTIFARPGDAPPRGNGAVLIVALFIAGTWGTSFAVKAWLVEAFQIPSAAMMPTLLVGDHMMVRKTKQIAPGDVIVFRYPADPDISYVKRAIAFGGQTIEVKDGVVSIDGAPLRQLGILGDCPAPADERDVDPGPCRLVKENNAGSWYTVMRGDAGAKDQPAFTIPPGHVYVMGDNRDNSSDSRIWGPLPLRLVQGKARFIWMSRDGRGGVRWERIGRSID